MFQSAYATSEETIAFSLLSTINVHHSLSHHLSYLEYSPVHLFHHPAFCMIKHVSLYHSKPYRPNRNEHRSTPLGTCIHRALHVDLGAGGCPVLTISSVQDQVIIVLLTFDSVSPSCYSSLPSTRGHSSILRLIHVWLSATPHIPLSSVTPISCDERRLSASPTC